MQGSLVFTTYAESESYITPNFPLFNAFYDYKEDSQYFYDFIRKKQLDFTTAKNKKSSNLSKVNAHLGIPNFLQFREDMETCHYNTLCLISIDNEATLFSHLGEEIYFKELHKLLESGRIFLNDFKDNVFNQIYMLSQSMFLIATDNKMDQLLFLGMMKNLYDRFSSIISTDEIAPIVFRFVVVLDKEKPLEEAFNLLNINKNTSNYFIYPSDEKGESLKSSIEVKIHNILKRAIKENLIVPYYQELHSNNPEDKNSHEALMRIIVDGKTYLPQDFMEVSKKYSLYTKISKILISKVFDDFYNIDSRVSINISVYDIESLDFQRFIFKKLKDFPKPENIVFEILEDEGFKNIDLLHAFIEEARSHGAKIAIDDFGSGYSNLLNLFRYLRIILKLMAPLCVSFIKKKIA